MEFNHKKVMKNVPFFAGACILSLSSATASAAFVGVSAGPSTPAASGTTVALDFKTGTPAIVGNEINYPDVGPPFDHDLTVTAWNDPTGGTSATDFDGILERADITNAATGTPGVTFGLGSCGTAGSFPEDPCNNLEQGINNSFLSRDYLLFQLTDAAWFEDITINFGTIAYADEGLNIWVGNSDGGTLDGVDADNLAFVTLFASGPTSTRTFDLGFRAGDSLIIGLPAIGSGTKDQNYVTGLTVVVPVPAAAWLFGSALVGLGALRGSKNSK